MGGGVLMTKIMDIKIILLMGGGFKLLRLVLNQSFQ